ncbi:DUF899 domain-containing protein [Actinokineospora auranticolor]|uniref:Putative dithiol-disulfide oxidoreductase (DUF899 family) n=1 Tax=Actinokineospora auranticolor TaxID=155976 RepID=A0A2S6GUG8_9PSEU|nr:DUF899 domain-containing protein [Actinokineospora auranticolor]PPK68837.1 putative dithiol-disulfide oxidoreductase (DUF899 family) [Actinokineospora auranticolor]
MVTPSVVPPSQWRREQGLILAEEKRITRELDALAARRRRMPAMAVEKDYVFEGADGPVTLLDMFEGRSQLIVYCFMWHEGAEPCSGCALFTDNVGELAHLNARDTTMAWSSPGPLADLHAFRDRMGWQIPWYSAQGNTFHDDFDAGTGFALNVFLRNGNDIYRTYFTTSRGVERLGSTWTFLDLTPLGRQETWEDSPDGHPQTAPYTWWRLHDDY